MSKAELARVRRISVGSADRLIRRQRWRRQQGNDGRARVLVPRDWLEPRHAEAANPTDIRLVADAVAALRDAVVALKERAELAESLTDAERRRADHALALVAEANARADRAEARADVADRHVEGVRDQAALEANASRLQIAALESRAETAESKTAATEAERDRLLASHNRALLEVESLREADRSRRSGGRLARLKAAWRGE